MLRLKIIEEIIKYTSDFGTTEAFESHLQSMAVLRVQK